MSFNIMKDVKPRLMALTMRGHYTPQIGRTARTIDEPGSYHTCNIKRLEDGCATSAHLRLQSRKAK